MKKLLLASLIIFGISCKKETPEAAPVAPAPSGLTNYVIVSGDGHNDDTIMLDSNSYSHNLISSGNYTALHIEHPSGSHLAHLTIPCSSIGTFPVQQHYPQWQISNLYVSGVNYVSPNLTATVTQYEAIGGIINCNYSGTFKKQSDTTVVITVSGNFNVIRGSDL